MESEKPHNNKGCNPFARLYRPPVVPEADPTVQAAIKIINGRKSLFPSESVANNTPKTPLEVAMERANNQMAYNRQGKPKIKPESVASQSRVKDKYGHMITTYLLKDGTTLVAYDEDSNAHTTPQG